MICILLFKFLNPVDQTLHEAWFLADDCKKSESECYAIQVLPATSAISVGTCFIFLNITVRYFCFILGGLKWLVVTVIGRSQYVC